ncbi:hypothetical protein [Enterobacter phage vB_EcRAM-01]|nr:hypothetical protein [Enterobacter phage vB_EcRAM-01]
MVDMSKEAVEARVAEALKDVDFGRFLDNAPTIPDTICLNCGRCVMVGKCCDNPNIVIMEKKEVSEEVWDQIQEIIKNPPEPTKRLRELMSRTKL